MSDHWHYASDIHGGAEQHHRHHDLERDIQLAAEHEHDAGKIYIGPSKGYLPDVLIDLEKRLQTALTLPELDAECGTCQGNGIVTAPEWLAWNEREKAAEVEWRTENPGQSWLSSEAFLLMSELQPEVAETDCPKCQGSGYVLTDAGRDLLRFLQRHPPALTRT